MSLWQYWQDEWNLYPKVTFDGQNKLIIVAPGVTELDVKVDVYSAWKEWVKLYDYTKWPQAMRSVGGDPISDTQDLGSTYFLINGWKMRTWEGDHRLVVKGNIYTDDGSNVFLPTLGSHNIVISLTLSNLIDFLDTGAVADLVWADTAQYGVGTKAEALQAILRLSRFLAVK